MGFPNELFTSFGDNNVRARIDEDAIIEDNWEPSDTRAALFWRRTEIIFRLRTAQALHLEFAPPLTARQYSRINLPGVAQAVDTVLAACTLEGEELARYNAWATEQLQQSWLQAFRRSYSGDYDHAYRGLQRVGAIHGPPLRPGSYSDRPIPDAELVSALMSYMQTSGRCIYSVMSSDQAECPLDMPTRQALIYFLSGDENVQPNLQWTQREVR